MICSTCGEAGTGPWMLRTTAPRRCISGRSPRSRACHSPSWACHSLPQPLLGLPQPLLGLPQPLLGLGERAAAAGTLLGETCGGDALQPRSHSRAAWRSMIALSLATTASSRAGDGRAARRRSGSIVQSWSASCRASRHRKPTNASRNSASTAAIASRLPSPLCSRRAASSARRFTCSPARTRRLHRLPGGPRQRWKASVSSRLEF
jgi:hypothetical protein